MFHQENANKCFTKVGMAAGTTSTLTTANAAQLSIMGKSVLKAATSNQVTPTTDAITGAAFTPITAGRTGVFTVFYDAAGALKVGQGQIVENGTLAPWFCPQDNALAPVGYILVRCNTGAAAWTFGTSNLTGPPSNVVITYVDCAGGMPPRPQLS